MAEHYLASYLNDHLAGSEIAFRRDEEKFVYLEHPEGQPIMLCHINRSRN